MEDVSFLQFGAFQMCQDCNKQNFQFELKVEILGTVIPANLKDTRLMKANEDVIYCRQKPVRKISQK